MRDALNKTGRPILYSIDNKGHFNIQNWGYKTANSWRISKIMISKLDMKNNYIETSK